MVWRKSKTDMDSFRERLQFLFAQIEKEFDTLYMENLNRELVPRWISVSFFHSGAPSSDLHSGLQSNESPLYPNATLSTALYYSPGEA